MKSYWINKIKFWLILPFYRLFGLSSFELALNLLAKKQRFFLYAQAAFETGRFQDYKFLKYNNPWGMRIPFGPSKRNGEINNYSTYSDLFDAVYDYLLYVYARSGQRTAELFENLSEFPETNDDFATWAAYIYRLKLNKYYEAKYEDYLEGVWKYRNLHPNNFIRYSISNFIAGIIYLGTFTTLLRLVFFRILHRIKK